MRGSLIALAASRALPRKARWLVLRVAGVRSDAWNICPGCFFSGDVEIGRGTFINRDCFFDGFAPITIGERCAIGMRVSVLTSTHEIGGAYKRAGALKGRPVSVGDGCWIGAQAVVLPGVTVGAGCVIASGAVVNQDCAPNGVYAGVPARLVRAL